MVTEKIINMVVAAHDDYGNGRNAEYHDEHDDRSCVEPHLDTERVLVVVHVVDEGQFDET